MIIESFCPDGQFPDAAGLAKCALICQDWHRIANPPLYRQIAVFGTKQFTLLADTLRRVESLRSRIRALWIHDMTSTKGVSPGFLRPAEYPPNLEQLFIFGLHKRMTNIFPNNIWPCLSRFLSLRHFHLHQLRLRSFDELRRIICAIPALESAILREVSWHMVERSEFRPLPNATSWTLSRISFADCTSNFVAPFFWGVPPQSAHSRLSDLRDGLHPPLSPQDVDAIVELAKFVLNPPESGLGSICWEWAKSDGVDTCKPPLYLPRDDLT